MTYYRVTGIIFGIVAVVHLLRIVMGWSVNLAGWSFPAWLSIVAVVVAGYLSYLGCVKFGKWI